jgi:hypothetical protein
MYLLQLRFSLSNASAWNENDGCFSYPVFYNNICDFFEDVPGTVAQGHTKSLLSWWTRYTLCWLLITAALLTVEHAEKSLEITGYPHKQGRKQGVLSPKWQANELPASSVGGKHCA